MSKALSVYGKVLMTLSRNRELVLYAVLMAILIYILHWFEFRFLLYNNPVEVYLTVIALVFMGLGVWLALKLAKPKVKIETVVVEKEILIKDTGNFTLNEREKEKLGLSNRELDVLQLMGEGLSNQEIADRLFVSLNTVKTHSSRVFEKLDVKRRTQAVEKARLLRLIA